MSVHSKKARKKENREMGETVTHEMCEQQKKKKQETSIQAVQVETNVRQKKELRAQPKRPRGRVHEDKRDEERRSRRRDEGRDEMGARKGGEKPLKKPGP